MSKDVAIGVRDKLNEMSEELLDERACDVEREACACCIAMAVEALEDWIYDGKMFPSVIPIKPRREWFRMPDGQKDDEVWEGPPWDRKKKPEPTIEDKFPTLVKLKKKKQEDAKRAKMAGRKAPPEEPEEDLDTRGLAGWSSYEKKMLDEGDRSGLIRAVVCATRCSVKNARAYIDRLERENIIERV